MRWLALLISIFTLSTAAHAYENQADQYDALGRLVQVGHSGTVNNGIQTTYTFDKAGNRTQTVTGVAYDTDAQTYFTAMTVQPDSTRKALINTLIVGLKADNLWTKIGWLSLVAAHDAQAGRLNAKNPAQAFTAVNSPTFTVDRGYQGNGTSAYLNAGVTMMQSGNFTRNSGFFSVYSNSNGAGSVQMIAGWWGSGNFTRFYSDSGATYLRSVSQTGWQTGSFTTAHTLDTGSRTASNALAWYEGAVQTATATTAPGSTDPTTTVTIGGAVGIYDTARYAIVAWGAGLSSTEVLHLNARLSAYLTAIGAN